MVAAPNCPVTAHGADFPLVSWSRVGMLSRDGFSNHHRGQNSNGTTMQQTASVTAHHPLVHELHQLVTQLRAAEFKSGLLDGDSELSTRKRDIADELDGQVRAKLHELEQRLLDAEPPETEFADRLQKEATGSSTLQFPKYPPFLRFALGDQVTPLQEAYILFRYEHPWVALKVLRDGARKREAAHRARARRIGEIEVAHPNWAELQPSSEAADRATKLTAGKTIARRAGILGLVLVVAATLYVI